jgi:hypothetical protein
VIGCPLLSQNETEAFIFFRAGKRRKQLWLAVCSATTRPSCYHCSLWKKNLNGRSEITSWKVLNNGVLSWEKCQQWSKKFCSSIRRAVFGQLTTTPLK